MSTVMAVYNSEGCVGRCDDHCHSATHPRCTCICGGLYHGAKVRGTFEALREAHGEAILAEARKRAKAEGCQLEVPGEAPLFARMAAALRQPPPPPPPATVRPARKKGRKA